MGTKASPDNSKKKTDHVTITMADLLMGRDKTYAHEFKAQKNLTKHLKATVLRINRVCKAYGHPMHVDSGWRPPSVNAVTKGAACHSDHMLGLAVDFADPHGAFRKWCLANLAMLQHLGLWLEDFRWTPTWVHLQLTTITGQRIFAGPGHEVARTVRFWNGHYDRRFDGHLNSYSQD